MHTVQADCERFNDGCNQCVPCRQVVKLIKRPGSVTTAVKSSLTSEGNACGCK